MTKANQGAPFDAKKMLREVLKVTSIAERVSALNLSEAQIAEALPILMAVAEEEASPTSAKLLYRTSFDLGEDSKVVRTKVLTAQGEKSSYLKTNVLSLPYYDIDFEVDLKFKKMMKDKKSVKASRKFCVKLKRKARNVATTFTGLKALAKRFY